MPAPLRSFFARPAGLLCVIVALVAGTAASPGDAQLRDRPTAKTKLDPREVDELAQLWRTDRRPTLVVVLGIERGGKLVYAADAAANPALARQDGAVRVEAPATVVSRVLQPVQRELLRAIPRGIVVPSVQDLNDKGLLDSLNRDVGADFDTGLLKRTYNADIVLDIQLTGGPRAYAVSYTATDTRGGDLIASMPLRSIPANADPMIGSIFGTAICSSFIEQYRNFTRVTFRRVELTLLGVAGERVFDNRVMRRLVRDIRDLRDVDDADYDWADENRVGRAELTVFYEGRTDDLLLDIEDEVLPEHELAWRVQQDDDGRIVAIVFADAVPDWFRLTDTDDSEFDDAVRRRNATLARQGLPRVGVVIGNDLDDPIAVLKGEVDQPGLGFNVSRLQPAIENVFTDLGFAATDGSLLRRQLDAQKRNAERYDNLDHMLEAMASLDRIDYVLHANVVANDDGDTAIVARLADVAGARFIGSQSWPTVETNSLNRFRVEGDDPQRLARYLAGQLVKRWDRDAQQRFRTAQVQLRNLDDAQQVVAVAELLENGVDAVRSITDLQIASPVGTFEVVYEGELINLVFPALALLGEQYPGAELQPMGDTLIVNFRPAVLSEKEVAKLRRKQVNLGDETPTGDEPVAADAPDLGSPDDKAGTGDDEWPAPLGSSIDRVAAALREHKSSVWLIYVEAGGSGWTGTGWTVGDGLLATNAHVVDDVPERLARGENVKAIAMSDANQAVVLQLGRAWRHPRWSDAASRPEDFWYDVGLFEVVSGDAGRPIPLAGVDELEELDTPVPVGYVGFPSGGTFTRLEGKLPVKQAFTGHVNAILSISLSPDPTAEDRMLSHNLVTSGGASGSPIFNDEGKVIALHNSGSMAEMRVRTNDGQTGRGFVKSGYNGGVMVDILIDYMDSIRGELPTGAR